MRHAAPSSIHHHHHQSNGSSSLRDVTMSSATGPSPSSGSTVVSSAQPTSFPQYFPVFDYGNGMMNGNGTSYGNTPILDMPSPSGVQRRSSGSPEGNMQSTWQDFVMGLQMT
jgi:hypothetical protein